MGLYLPMWKIYLQAALVSLALYILQHPDTLREVIVLGKKLVQAILDDPESVEKVKNWFL